MGFSFPYWQRGLPLAAVVWLTALAAPAQHSLFRPGQPIVFSSPEDGTTASNLPSLSPRPPGALDFKDEVQAPNTFNFGSLPDTMPLPPGPPLVMPGEAARQQNLLDRRNNWMLLTPAEILGTTTPEAVMGIPERDAFGRPKNATAMERYTERQNQLLLTARTNDFQTGDSSSAWDVSGYQYGMSNSISGRRAGPGGMGNPLFDATSDDPTSARSDGSGGWTKLFGSPAAAAPGPDTAQLAEMERFRQLLNPGSSSLTPSATPAADGIRTSLPKTLLGSALDQPAPARIGATFTPLTSGIGKPAALPKLPGAWNLNYTSAPPAAAWAPQPAPWLSPDPQPLAPPQRKF